MSNDSVDKLAEVYASDESDAKAYQKAQAQTIVSQSKQINEMRKKLEEISTQLEQLTIENTRLKALGADTAMDNGISDQETICMVQLALLNNYSMQRELTLEETKKVEIYTKLVISLHGKKDAKEENPILGLSNEELMEAMKAL